MDHAPNAEGQPIKYGLGARHVQVFTCFVCITVCFLSTGHMGVTIVAMTIVEDGNDTADPNISTKIEVAETLSSFESVNVNLTSIDNATHSMGIYTTYDWPKSVQEIVLGAYFFGTAFMTFPSGLICQRWGGKVLLQYGLLVCGLTSFITPWCIPWGSYMMLSFLRFCQGMSQAGLYPAINTLLSNWVPVNERNSLSSFVYAGSSIGSILGFQVAGILADSVLQWPSTFWVIGLACFVAFILMTIFGSATPKDCKYITEDEKMYILRQAAENVETKAKVPWKQVLTSVPVWAAMITHVGNSVTFLFFFTQVPTYVYGVLNFNVMDSGLITSITYIGSGISALVFGNLSDFLTNRKYVTIKAARIIFNSIACLVPAACLISVAYTTNTFFAVICFVTFSTANCANFTGWMVNYMDLSPNYCGALNAIGNTITAILTVVLPIIISNVVKDVTNQYQWRVVMLILAGFTCISHIIFILFMSTEIQPWNKGDD
ncbi:unnamed protein product [Euphydryas editha]|uniref:Major facilitator superfamily (MFS) profile domain-containing protein n=1 Tax=Euphydryas editha TaxID=104508 RepID=A0AAU9UF38_EUPED|nr:unnamed protein product [Euphydryas editha]